MKKGIIYIGIILHFYWASAQKTNFICGAGNFEYLHFGICAPIYKRFKFQTSVGFKPYGFRKTEIYTFNNRLNYQILKNARLSKFIVAINSILWYFNNASNQFFNFSVGPEIGYYVAQYRLELHAGIVYNSVLKYTRKTYNEIGWPNNWMPSFGLILHLNKKQ